MKQLPQIHRFTWSDIEIEAAYWSVRWGAIDHLEIRSIAPERAPLPITQADYCSHFHPRGTIEVHGGDVVAQAIAWLDDEVRKPRWRDYVDGSRQGELFPE